MNRIKHADYQIVLLIISILFIGGCSDTGDDLDRFIKKTKMKKGRVIEPIPDIAEPEKFQYPETLKRRNPFKPVGKETANQDQLAPDYNRPKMPLEQFPLDSLKFVGTLKDSRTRWGLISDPSGRITRVKTGDYMGKNYGRIISISNASLELEESLKVGGQWKKKKTTFRLKAER